MNTQSTSLAPQTRSHASRWLRLGAFSIVASAFVFHFAATLLYLTPLNSIKADMLTSVTGYIDPYFTQNWSMFAPDPILDDDRIILVQCRVKDGDTTVDRPTVDVTTRLRQTQWKYRLTPALRLLRTQLSPVEMLAPAPDPLTDNLAKLADDGDPDLAAVGKEVKKTKEKNDALANRLLVRVASEECDRLEGPGRTVAVRPTLVMASAPVFSKRMTNDLGAPKELDFDWHPAESPDRM